MDGARAALARMRESVEAWPELRYEPGTDDEGYACDRNAARRAAVLWALQYDRRPGDLALLRWLAEQEAVCRREAPFQGLTEDTQLAGFLLAEHGQLEDVWRHWAIKRANFDAWCAYDVEHLVAAGVQDTLDFVRGSGHPDRDDVLERLREAQLTEDGRAEWVRAKRLWFPDDPDDEEPLTWVERAKLVGDRALARRLLDRWAADAPRDRSTLDELRYELTDLGDFAGAAAVQRESLAFVEGAWDCASAWQTLAELERRAGHYEAARSALGECGRALREVDGWRRVGLGREYVEELFRLAGAASGELASDVFAEADRQAPDVANVPLVVLQAAVDAADRVGETARRRHYERLRDAERQRIES